MNPKPSEHGIQSALPLRAVIALTVVIGIALASALVYLEEATRIREEHTANVQVELERLTTLTALALRESLWQFVPQQADSIIEAAFVNPEVTSIKVIEDGGKPFASKTRNDFRDEKTLIMKQDIVRDGVRLGQLTISMTTAGYRQKLRTVTIRYGRAGILIIIGSLLFILFVMHRRFVRPMDRLVEASQNLAQGKLEIPIKAIRHDELGILAQSLEETRKSLLDLFSKVEQRNAELKDVNEHLEQRVEERTRSLEETLQTLNRAQHDMIQTEKLASLGRVVAGVAHELNTPIGNALLVASTINGDLRELRAEVDSGNIRRSTLSKVLNHSQAGFDIFFSNLERAARIVGDFKQVAVDQTSEQRRKFDLGNVSGEILTMLNPAIRKTGCTVNLQAEPDLLCDSYPGPYGQVLNNLIMNAILHAFDNRADGVIQVVVKRLNADYVQLIVSDNGSGMEEDVRKQIFDPFFTTKMGNGGTGLGMNIVHGIVVRILGGTIAVSSTVNQGTQILVTIPTVSPAMKV
ncbi:HAMP domain-containing protein [Undibacterium sp. Jales W-56]|uniref:sensor histidine kinase n=1 Tax=Undibacterium sp. Jales W-56 TaxID=2897325 RepID=UPI0021D1E794|nr:ATP-binding protein [Undibacterium sp. Jales W-56]MCU6432542.1 HAMP domain-containing protein [Undibacterium sp. Jales W-56]